MGAAQTAMLAFSIAVLAMVFLAPDLHTLFRAGGTPPAETRQQRPNVMLIVLDTVRADRLSCYGNTTLATPNIDELARGGLLFLNAFSTAPWTVPSHASMFTGLYPSQHQAAWDNTRLRDEFVTLAERLTESGYASADSAKTPSWVSPTASRRGLTSSTKPGDAPCWSEPSSKLFEHSGGAMTSSTPPAPPPCSPAGSKRVGATVARSSHSSTSWQRISLVTLDQATVSRNGRTTCSRGLNRSISSQRGSTSPSTS